jgi:hypothetical protein
MNELLSLNIFAEFLLAALLGVGLFFGLLALPMFVSGERFGAANRPGTWQKHRDGACDSACPCLSAGGSRVDLQVAACGTAH